MKMLMRASHNCTLNVTSNIVLFLFVSLWLWLTLIIQIVMDYFPLLCVGACRMLSCSWRSQRRSAEHLKTLSVCTLIYTVASCCAHLQTSVSELKCVCYQVCINPELVRCVSRCARGCLSPLAAAVGGIASQEVLKALTGKFSPVQQWVSQSSCTLAFKGL